MKKILSVVFIFFITNSCKTKEIVPIPPTLAVVSTSELTINSARLSSEISDIGNQYISDYGVVYSETNATPTLADSKISHGAVAASNIVPVKFSDVIQGLKPSTNYYARSYSIIASGVVFGQITTFKTTDIIQPSVKTDAVILVFETSAKLRGIIESKGTYDVSEYGICWSATNAIPTTADFKSSKTNLSVFPTIYTEDANNLTPNTSYYFRAFLVSNGITSYGNVLTFKTLAISQPSIKTLEAKTITVNSVQIRGSVETKGTYDITEYGICWSQRFTTPTTDHSKAKILGNLSTFPTVFTVDINELAQGGIIYYRAYIISNGVTSYSDVLNYTLEVDGFPTLTTDGSINLDNASQRLQATIKTKGNYNISEYGICWSFAVPYPTITDAKISISENSMVFPTTFTVDAKGLQAHVVYFYRAYLISNGAITYGSVKSFIL
ncbi:hypothetical protein [Emticicia sp. SJ17W-69]|uniref:hypothetical protein n=1 Tax=Emticicia sp. SJ17W-69 TaxID=3421657 RepID=UPI003EBC91CE